MRTCAEMLSFVLQSGRKANEDLCGHNCLWGAKREQFVATNSLSGRIVDRETTGMESFCGQQMVPYRQNIQGT